MTAAPPTLEGAWSRFGRIWLACGVLLAAAVVAGGAPLGGMDILAREYLARQDLPALLVGWGVIALAPVLAGTRLGRARASLPPGLAAGLAAAAVAAVGYAGVRLVFENHALTGDELMVVFDTAILREGRTAAPVPAEWRPFLPAMQPIFRTLPPDHAWWVSAYLPVNAAARALFGRLGDPALAGPFWAGLSIVLVYGVGRRLRPERPAYALTAAVLLATSAQVAITAMTPYAMSAHLALNLLWLWLVLRGGVAGHLGAGVAALAATGLHQLVFHPLFAAPFVLRMWLERRWGPALWHTLAYAAIGLFWASYWRLAMPTPPGGAATDAGGLLEKALGLVASFHPSDPHFMALNLVRFMTWQNPLLVPLLLAGAWAAGRRDPAALALWGALLGTLGAMVLLLPYQGHGWGYRYLHGLLGVAALLAAGGWLRWVDGLAEAERSRAWAGFGVVAAATALVLLPLRGWQANRYIHPQAAASQAIAAAEVEVVLVESTRIPFGWDLVRNDPWLQERPKVLLLEALGPDAIAQLCRRGPVRLFDATTAARFGIRLEEEPAPPEAVRARAALAQAGCATPF